MKCTKLMRLAMVAGVVAASAAAMADSKDRTSERLLLEQPDGTLILAPNNATVTGFVDGYELPGFGVRGIECTGTACQGNVATFSGTNTFRRSDLLVITTGGQQQTWRAADNFSVDTDGAITQFCVLGGYVTPTPAIAPTPAGATWRLRYYPDAGGFPCLIPRAEFIIGGATPTAGTSVTVTPNILNTDTNAASLWNRYTFDHPAVNVTAGECLWVEVVDIQNLTSPFFAVVSQAGVPNGDDRMVQLAVVGANSTFIFDTTDVVTGSGMNFCVNVGTSLDTTTNCPVVGVVPPPNDDVSNAVTLTIGDPAVAGTTTNAQQDFVRPCGFSMGDAPGVWYRVTGNGNVLTVNVETSACADPVVVVYDATMFDGPMGGTDESLICVGDDDDSGTGVAASFSWCSGDGTSYLVWVRPADQSLNNAFSFGPFTIAVSNGAPCDTPDGANCDVTMQMGDVLENEACGTSTSANCAGNPTLPGEPFTIGSTVFGTHSTVFATSRNFDGYTFTIAGGPRELVFTYQSGAPIVLQVLSCTTPTAPTLFAGLVVFLPACAEGEVVRARFPDGNYVVQLVPFGFGGLDGCSTDYINYRLTIADALTGACCTGTSCSISTEIACFDANGVFQGDGTACDAGVCAAGCDLTLAGGDTAEAEACQGTSLAAGVPTPNGTCGTGQAVGMSGGTFFGNVSTNVTGVPNGTAIRDLDFYTFTMDAPGDVMLSLTAEADALLAVVNCPDGTFVLPFVDVGSCEATNQTVSLPAGNFAVVVTSAEFTGQPCAGGTNDYRLVVDFGGPAPCPPDFNMSGNVDLLDLLAFNAAWSNTLGQSVTPGTGGDFNMNGTVDLLDLLAFNGAWSALVGQSCP